MVRSRQAGQVLVVHGYRVADQLGEHIQYLIHTFSCGIRSYGKGCEIVVGRLKILKPGNLLVKKPFHDQTHDIPEGNLERHLQNRNVMFLGKREQQFNLGVRILHLPAPL